MESFRCFLNLIPTGIVKLIASLTTGFRNYEFPIGQYHHLTAFDPNFIHKKSGLLKMKTKLNAKNSLLKCEKVFLCILCGILAV